LPLEIDLIGAVAVVVEFIVKELAVYERGTFELQASLHFLILYAVLLLPFSTFFFLAALFVFG
jgi:hypothetical protein